MINDINIDKEFNKILYNNNRRKNNNDFYKFNESLINRAKRISSIKNSNDLKVYLESGLWSDSLSETSNILNLMNDISNLEVSDNIKHRLVSETNRFITKDYTIYDWGKICNESTKFELHPIFEETLDRIDTADKDIFSYKIFLEKYNEFETDILAVANLTTDKGFVINLNSFIKKYRSEIPKDKIHIYLMKFVDIGFERLGVRDEKKTIVVRKIVNMVCYMNNVFDNKYQDLSIDEKYNFLCDIIDGKLIQYVSFTDKCKLTNDILLLNWIYLSDYEPKINKHILSSIYKMIEIDGFNNYNLLFNKIKKIIIYIKTPECDEIFSKIIKILSDKEPELISRMVNKLTTYTLLEGKRMLSIRELQGFCIESFKNEEIKLLYDFINDYIFHSSKYPVTDTIQELFYNDPIYTELRVKNLNCLLVIINFILYGISNRGYVMSNDTYKNEITEEILDIIYSYTEDEIGDLNETDHRVIFELVNSMIVIGSRESVKKDKFIKIYNKFKQIHPNNKYLTKPIYYMYSRKYGKKYKNYTNIFNTIRIANLNSEEAVTYMKNTLNIMLHNSDYSKDNMMVVTFILDMINELRYSNFKNNIDTRLEDYLMDVLYNYIIQLDGLDVNEIYKIIDNLCIDISITNTDKYNKILKYLVKLLKKHNPDIDFSISLFNERNEFYITVSNLKYNRSNKVKTYHGYDKDALYMYNLLADNPEEYEEVISRLDYNIEHNIKIIICLLALYLNDTNKPKKRINITLLLLNKLHGYIDSINNRVELNSIIYIISDVIYILNEDIVKVVGLEEAINLISAISNKLDSIELTKVSEDVDDPFDDKYYEFDVKNRKKKDEEYDEDDDDEEESVKDKSKKKDNKKDDKENDDNPDDDDFDDDDDDWYDDMDDDDDWETYNETPDRSKQDKSEKNRIKERELSEALIFAEFAKEFGRAKKNNLIESDISFKNDNPRIMMIEMAKIIDENTDNINIHIAKMKNILEESNTKKDKVKKTKDIVVSKSTKALNATKDTAVNIAKKSAAMSKDNKIDDILADFGIIRNSVKDKVQKASDLDKKYSSRIDTVFDRATHKMKKNTVSKNREAVIRGSLLPSLSSLIKLCTSSAIITAMGQPILGLITLIGGATMSIKANKDARKEIADEIEVQMKVVDKKIQYVENENDFESYAILLKIRKRLEKEYKRINFSSKNVRNATLNAIGKERED